jgi:hypothetical protein
MSYISGFTIAYYRNASFAFQEGYQGYDMRICSSATMTPPSYDLFSERYLRSGVPVISRAIPTIYLVLLLYLVLRLKANGKFVEFGIWLHD